MYGIVSPLQKKTGKSVVWNTECSPERGPEWAGMRLRRVWLESAQERPWKPGVLRPGSALLARERGLSGRALSVCCIEVCIGIVYWSCVRPGFACPDPSCVCGERYQPSCVCDGAVCADVRCVWSSTVFGRTKAGWQRWVVSIVGNVRSFHVSGKVWLIRFSLFFFRSSLLQANSKFCWFSLKDGGVSVS